MKILAVTGIRSEYDIIYPLLKELRRKKHEVYILISGAHLSDFHDNTYNNIQEDALKEGFIIADKVDSLISTSRLTQRPKNISLLMLGLSTTCERIKPDILLVLGDREESIATCIVGNYMDILTAHYGGGDPVYGNADDPVRFACSKLAHIHIVTSEAYKENLINIGEEEFRIINAGNSAYSNIYNEAWMSKEDVRKTLNIDKKDYIVFLKHPLSSEVNEAGMQMEIALKASSEFVRENDLEIVGIYPNTDPGSLEMISLINSLNVKFHKTLKRNIFINLMRHALALVGNSSMGILEAPFYKIPVVNIGNRQKGRLNAGNVEFVPYEVEKIKEALFKACFDEKYREHVRSLNNPYGDERAPEIACEFISNINLNDRHWYVKKKLC